jgi:hypothetical protein
VRSSSSTVDEISRSLRIDENIVLFLMHLQAFGMVGIWFIVEFSVHTGRRLHMGKAGLVIHFARMIERHAHIAALMMESYQVAESMGDYPILCMFRAVWVQIKVCYGSGRQNEKKSNL